MHRIQKLAPTIAASVGSQEIQSASGEALQLFEVDNGVTCVAVRTLMRDDPPVWNFSNKMFSHKYNK
jgi:hypothetical protein